MIRFERNVTSLLPVLEKVAKYSTILWTLQFPVTWRPKTVQMNRKLAILNSLLVKSLQNSSVKIWESFHQAFDVFSDTTDGIHFGGKGLNLILQIILNFLFNGVAPEKEGTCCSSDVPKMRH
ncbi:hypothetical protein RvY_02091-3 [Ramazzottius varieornatus]|uniref:Uncharacterized protein n=1 Tax=Ramazzottius varieornatus TaxID=947166 RepID=A0A1D1UIJ0_RAMVA|nr:hypothetical protein RvY_02091-3 [Ramazzottius varieornatus]